MLFLQNAQCGLQTWVAFMTRQAALCIPHPYLLSLSHQMEYSHQVARTLESLGQLKQGGPVGLRLLLRFPLSASLQEFYATGRRCLVSMVWLVVPQDQRMQILFFWFQWLF
ncbi:unnamed protein product [Rangifer tarandus platyrhynchus]|uniref:Uncharacterized protein n=2 Tax=Rangifer tarandus platyrhynchus TaxID=3082113 RepID=A0AC59ZUS9_RANTA|nr:unnamed protein product [Rangifer tarandus platyrhynchus]